MEKDCSSLSEQPYRLMVSENTSHKGHVSGLHLQIVLRGRREGLKWCVKKGV